jgi:hypothetical protein
MAEYPSHHIKALDAVATKEGMSLVTLILLDMVVVVVAIYIVGMIANAIV